MVERSIWQLLIRVPRGRKFLISSSEVIWSFNNTLKKSQVKFVASLVQHFFRVLEFTLEGKRYRSHVIGL